MYPLSKSALQAGAQCPRMLWFRYNREQRDTSGEDAFAQEQFIIGDLVGAAAQGYFKDDPGRTVIIDTSAGFDDRNYADYARQTQQAMNDPSVSVIAEAAFYTGELIVFVDLLRRNEDGSWDIYEVKSSRQAKPVHARDCAWQTYVVRTMCGVNVRKSHLMIPARGWSIFNGKAQCSPEDFEIVDDYSDWIHDQSVGREIPEKVAYFTDMVQRSEPPACECTPGRGMCCASPYPCDYVGACERYAREGR